MNKFESINNLRNALQGITILFNFVEILAILFDHTLKIKLVYLI